MAMSTKMKKSIVSMKAPKKGTLKVKEAEVDPEKLLKGACFGCGTDTTKEENKKVVVVDSAVPPYNRKIVCKNCDRFIKWDECKVSDELRTKIDSFFNTVDLGMDKFYVSLYYQWKKNGNLSVKQIESLYKHPQFT